VAAAFLPSDTAIYGASAMEVRKFRRSDGAIQNTWVVSNGDGIYIPPNGLTITPNGRLIYVRQWTYSFVGLIGTSPSLTVTNPPANGGSATAILSAVNLSDANGNNDGVPNAGEIITLSPAFTNPGAQPATNVSVDVAVGTGGTLLSPSSQTFGTITAGSTGTLQPFRIQMDQSIPSRSTFTVTFTAHWGSGQSKVFPYTVVAHFPITPTITSITKSGNDIVVGYSAIAGKKYSLQYTSDSLTSPHWSGTPYILATADGPAYLTDISATPRARVIYRVSQLEE
jgi:uncharacterized repeat protein (TIGR01451 family)